MVILFLVEIWLKGNGKYTYPKTNMTLETKKSNDVSPSNPKMGDCLHVSLVEGKCLDIQANNKTS